MADEITINLRLQVTKGNLTHREDPGVLSVTMTGSNGTGGIQNIVAGGTAGETLTMGDTGTAGWSFFRNTDSVNFVEIGIQVAGTFYPFVKLKAGESCLLRLGTNTPYARSNTATTNLQYFIVSD